MALTNPGDVVFDPYAGVGTVLLASDLLDRRGVMADIEPAYCALARTRLDDLRNGTLKIRPIGTKIFEPKGTEKMAQIPLEWGSGN